MHFKPRHKIVGVVVDGKLPEAMPGRGIVQVQKPASPVPSLRSETGVAAWRNRTEQIDRARQDRNLLRNVEHL